VFLTTWYDDLAALPETEAMGQDYWQTLLNVRDAVNKEIERQRAQKRIGSALNAEVTLYVDADLQTALEKLGDELRFVLITSTATVLPIAERSEEAVATELDGLWVVVKASQQEKCVRCWHHRSDVGQDKDHPELCGRCVENVAGKGEKRHYA